MPPTFVFFYLMANDLAAIRTTVPAHVAYWRGLGLADYRAGPFGDRSGGLITFRAEQLLEATRVVERDPFVVQRLVSSYWIKEWVPNSPHRLSDRRRRAAAASSPTSWGA
jgi:uncharacterized protein YciI